MLSTNMLEVSDHVVVNLHSGIKETLPTRIDTTYKLEKPIQVLLELIYRYDILILWRSEN